MSKPGDIVVIGGAALIMLVFGLAVAAMTGLIGIAVLRRFALWMAS